MSLAGILDDFEPSGGRNREQRLDIGGVPVEVDGHDRFGSRCQPALHLAGIQCIGLRIDVGEDHPGTGALDGDHGRHGGQGARDDLIPGADARAEQR